MASQGHEEQQKHAPPHRRVLVVEDEDDIRDTLADVLTAEGYVVETAQNGLEALALVKSMEPDLVLVDLMMPVMNGWDFHRRIRQNPSTAGLRVVAVSAIQDDNSAERFDGYLRKPFDISALLATVQGFCRAA